MQLPLNHKVAFQKKTKKYISLHLGIQTGNPMDGMMNHFLTYTHPLLMKKDLSLSQIYWKN